MTISEQVKNTPPEDRPLIDDTPGRLPHHMDDKQYMRYLEDAQKKAQLPKPGQPTGLEARVEKVEHDVDDLNCIITGKGM